ncbi:aminotransferase-like domain-containing protein [Devosia sediminis]|uniref:aminotransferase-like domain-containing protein n=1 Tax=Devosia sediminis TaxID=2798801 RepID=UPI003FA41C68
MSRCACRLSRYSNLRLIVLPEHCQDNDVRNICTLYAINTVGAPATMWIPKVDRDKGPLYLAIADAIELDVVEGRLAPGTKLPPQRALAQGLGLDFTTVTRAYAEAGRRDLVEGRVGQGTFIKGRSPQQAIASAGLVDMSMNLPPIPQDGRVAQSMWARMANMQGPEATRLMLRYQEPGGALKDRVAGATWLSGRLPDVDVGRLLVAPGAQGALTAVVATLAKRGDVVLTEPLTYPGFISLAGHFGVRLFPMQMDESGPVPEALEEAIRTLQPKAIYCTPTLNNPTTRTWSAERRSEIAEVAAMHSIPIIEDDAYGALKRSPLPTLLELAKGPVYHIASLSKCLAPALRVAYLVAPDRASAIRVIGALRGTTAMASPLTTALATDWISSGLAFDFLDELRAETSRRQMAVAKIMPTGVVNSDPEGFHVWLDLPSGWPRGEFVARLRNLGISGVASDAFAIVEPPEGVRLGLGGASGVEELERSLTVVAALIKDRPALGSLIV